MREIKMREKGLRSLADNVSTVPSQPALLHSIVNGQVEVSDAWPRIGNGAIH